MTTRPEIVRRAVRLIGNEACAADIGYTLNVLEVAQTKIEFRSKSSKKAAERFSVALRKVRSTAKRLLANLRYTMFAEWADKRDPFDNGDQSFARAITRLLQAADRYASEPSSKLARGDHKKHLAAQEALWLMRKYRIDILTTKGGTFCKLAALLYGKPRADLEHHCRAALQSRGTDRRKALDLR
jgi:hypothetical protein